MRCKICNKESNYVFNAKVLNIYDVAYYRCFNCGFLQTENPFWLHEAYKSAITNLDLGLLYRNVAFRPITSAVINAFFDAEGDFLDYGGGYGIFTRLMRDEGYNFFRQDTYCENLFSKGFDVSDLKKKQVFEILSAFEVFEHLTDPIDEIEKMLKLSTNIFFSTELLTSKVSNSSDWWYIMPEIGQHVSFYSSKSLRHIAETFGLHFYTNGTNLHLLSKKKINTWIFKLLLRPKISLLYNLIKTSRRSFLDSDYNRIRESANNAI